MLIDHFKRCLNAKYIHTPESGEYAIEKDGNTLYLLFQWSHGNEDWKNNFDFPAKPYKRMTDTWYCHRGFMKVWKAMQDEVETKVAEMLSEFPEVTKIICVGYSHGAALAVFATEDMEYLHGGELFIDVYGYGFGCPRVLWGIVPKAVKARLAGFMVVRNIEDIVTHVPPACFGFRHIGHLGKIGAVGKYNPIDAHRPESYIAEMYGKDLAHVD